MFANRFIYVSIIFAVATIMAAGLPDMAIAQSTLTSPFSSWFESQRNTATRDKPDKPFFHKTLENRQPFLPSPVEPVLTPEDTRAFIEVFESAGETVTRSPLEKIYSKRIVEELKQFGYEMFAHPDQKNSDKTDKNNDGTATGMSFALPAGAVQDNFILSMGDQLDIVFRGQRKSRDTYTVTTQGILIVEDLPPVTAAGRTIGQVRARLQDYAERLHNTEVFVSLSSVKQINVLVVGHVNRPGRQNLTVFHTVLDALMEAEGVQKTGSLRQIKLIRRGRSTIVDLYGLLIHGSTAVELSLRDGDRIVVPPIGPTIAVAGGVKRPGIYEILPELRGMRHKPYNTSQTLSLQDVLDMSGGILSPGRNRFMKLGLTKDGHEMVEEIETENAYNPLFSDGSILAVAPSDEKRAGMVELAGHTRRPGLHALTKAKTLSALIDDRTVFGPDIYPLIGVIERWDDEQMSHQLLAFPPLLVVKKQFDRKLQDGDVVHLFSREQILDLQTTEGKENRKRQKKNEERFVAQGSLMEAPDTDLREDTVMVSFLAERSSFIRGAVRMKGAYPVAEGATLDSLIAVAGGLTLEANTTNIEVTSDSQGEGNQQYGRSGTRRISVNFRETNPNTVPISAGDTVRINQKFRRIKDNSVLVIGEVINPGRYDLLPGDTLSKLFNRAGGLTQQAYPEGAIFSRASERRNEEARFRATARDLEMKLAATLERKKGPEEEQIAAVQSLIDQLKRVEAVGRITIEASPSVLGIQPELDILLETGDRIFVPQRPLTVRVSGEVLSPASLQFRTDKAPNVYIDQAGGFTFHADKDRTFVLYPDGSAQPLLVNAWNHKYVFIPPGSTIVVPRDPKPFDFIETARDITHILSNLAITGVFIDDIRDN